MEYLAGATILLISAILYWAFRIQGISQQQKDQLQQQVQELLVENAVICQEKKQLEEKLSFAQTEAAKLNDRNALVFENLANRILEEKSRKFTLQNQENIERILHPLGKELESFRTKVQETYDRESKERFSLEQKVKELAELNRQIGDEARNLTNALKGNAKVRGNWGEAILETILQNSGLEPGRHYLVQEFLRDERGNYLRGPEGNRMQPDVTIIYPDQRKVLIDAKVSLLAYEKFFHAELETERSLAQRDHLKAIKNHIDELSGKQYESYSNVLDFVIMFVPLEAAYMTAVQTDAQLWEYAYKKRVLLISSSNLIAILKMIKDLWVRDDQSKNAMEIARRGGLLYDKFSSFVGNLEEIGKNLDRSSRAYEQAMNQLATGKGNLLSQAEKLRDLGVSAKNPLTAHLRGKENEEG
ncbi:DNA recombination protein RmuC [Lunatimonas lonarensis]|uniref:DNA recombination protein RmuC n=1 Tax=Lunatimonas lonarensis TaxID=1232681 RepID=R7ZS15_9BACT|nr:DNA recombination protein RmuC [Lunatimonas lonarensis]EON76936.1 DNA recombination protein RmuC [Lunatimonas lonarensis]